MFLGVIMIIGISGRSGTGKSYVSEILAKKLNLEHVNIDKVSHEVLELPETIKFLKSEFGENVFENGVLNRKTLGKIVFYNGEKLDLLNNFCQAQIEKKLDKIIATSTKPIILDYALLWKLKQFGKCDIKILLKSDFETRFERVAKRENISREYFKARDNSLNEPNIKFDYIFSNITSEQIDELALTIQKELSWLEKLQSFQVGLETLAKP